MGRARRLEEAPCSTGNAGPAAAYFDGGGAAADLPVFVSDQT
jgi:hypothetical protein